MPNSSILDIAVGKNRIYFVGSDGNLGHEIWTLELPPATQGPMLNFDLTPENLTFFWETGQILQETSDLVTPVTWTDVPAGNNGNTVPTTSGSKYYRLISR